MAGWIVFLSVGTITTTRRVRAATGPAAMKLAEQAVAGSVPFRFSGPFT